MNSRIMTQQAAARRYIRILCTFIAVFFLVQCEEKAQGPTQYYADAEEVITLPAENFSVFLVENLQGVIDFQNTDVDSIKITLSKTAGSEVSTERAEEYLAFISAFVDTIPPDTLHLVASWIKPTPEMSARIDMTVEVPNSLDIMTYLNYGKQFLNIKVPRNDEGVINVFNNVGDVYLYIPVSSSAVLDITVGSGRIFYEGLTINDLSLIPIGTGATLTGYLYDGKGLIKVFNNLGDIYLIGTTGQ